MKSLKRASNNATRIELEGLQPEQRTKLFIICRMVNKESADFMVELFHKYNLRRRFALYKYNRYEEFAKDELFKACEELTRIDLSFDWRWLLKVSSIILKKEGIEEGEETIWPSVGVDRIDRLFWEIISSAGLTKEYLEIDLDSFRPRLKFNPKDIPDLTSYNKIIELIGRLKYLEFLTEMVESGNFNRIPEIKKDLPVLPDIFRDKKDFELYMGRPEIRDLYDTHQDGTLHLKDRKKAYLAGFAHRLLNTGKLIDEIKTSQDLAKVFCPFFHVPYNNKEDKQFQPDRAKTDEFSFIV